MQMIIVISMLLFLFLPNMLVPEVELLLTREILGIESACLLICLAEPPSVGYLQKNTPLRRHSSFVG